MLESSGKWELRGDISVDEGMEGVHKGFT